MQRLLVTLETIPLDTNAICSKRHRWCFVYVLLWRRCDRWHWNDDDLVCHCDDDDRVVSSPLEFYGKYRNEGFSFCSFRWMEDRLTSLVSSSFSFVTDTRHVQTQNWKTNFSAINTSLTGSGFIYLARRRRFVWLLYWEIVDGKQTIHFVQELNTQIDGLKEETVLFTWFWINWKCFVEQVGWPTTLVSTGCSMPRTLLFITPWESMVFIFSCRK